MQRQRPRLGERERELGRRHELQHCDVVPALRHPSHLAPRLLLGVIEIRHDDHDAAPLQQLCAARDHTRRVPCGRRIETVDAGRSITYRRVKDYWGAKLPVRTGQDNFDSMRYDYYRDITVAVEALKAGEFDFRQENVAKNWATAYNVPVVTQIQGVTFYRTSITLSNGNPTVTTPVEMLFSYRSPVDGTFQTTTLALSPALGPNQVRFFDDIVDA